MSRRRDIIGGEMYAETLEPVTPSGVVAQIRRLKNRATISRLSASIYAVSSAMHATFMAEKAVGGESLGRLSAMAFITSIGGVAVSAQSAFARSQQASALEGALVSHQLANPGPSETPVLPPQ
jgi:hypothetical protein